ncbi:hypothetical protein KIN20_003394 [Parelaphostrongylus tenuis]|uniref:Uncharacterized protein n=1 Tax=Parelaphostrongylus tenuis TaxID=148309 RepID=A0AAD5MFL9_PARTN|nr:hypothetical protein KIN20_003394 [Parelaphostrongylus tenuis]
MRDTIDNRCCVSPVSRRSGRLARRPQGTSQKKHVWPDDLVHCFHTRNSIVNKMAEQEQLSKALQITRLIGGARLSKVRLTNEEKFIIPNYPQSPKLTLTSQE